MSAAPGQLSDGRTTSTLVQAALDFGFSHAGPLDPTTLQVRDEVRLMCAADRCQAFGRYWTCPPGSGTLDESRRIISGYRNGLLVQTTANLEDDFDYETMASTSASHHRRVVDFRAQLRTQYPAVIGFGNAVCSICEQCSYPDAPCRHPDLAIQSLEAFGVVVSDVCRDNDLSYYRGPLTITFTGAYLLEPDNHKHK